MSNTTTAWRNWSGSVSAPGANYIRPRDDAELSAAVRAAEHVRATGAGHSFMPLCESTGLIVSLEDMAGSLHILPDRKTARAPAGWSLKKLTAALWEEGLSLANQGDVNPQSLAGSMATGTHGTGASLGSLATLARGFQLMDGEGASRWVDSKSAPDLFEAQRLSLGLFGLATEIEFEVMPAYCLSEKLEKADWDDVRANFMHWSTQHRHIEFLMFPYSDQVILKTLDLCEDCPPPARTSDMEEESFRRAMDVCTATPWMIPTLQKAIMSGGFQAARKGPAYTIFPSDRTVPFEEMEYELPAAAGLSTMHEILRVIRKKKLKVSFPFEFRLVAADDIWMSPMNKGPVASISMHQYAKMKFQDVFAEIEPILRAAGGRPHWAKRHRLTRADVDALYPMAEKYREVRRAADPQGKFLNAHMKALFS